ncbi:hypothetical protein [Latilactobacillus fragifolii]|uniref:hypothetical protein n=1 Tax=Latilactobacillus fragifolii TaxID=2814244 RepID=UPI001ABB6A33|nr:hypothetical protein [Latilactobacillus fragifolii]
MNKDEFANLVNHMNPSYESKELCRKIINQVTMILSEYVMYTREKYPNTVDFVAVGSSGDGLSVSLSLMKDMLRYVFDDDKIIVTFNNSTVDTYTFDGTNMISEKHKHPFELSDVEQELNNFK